MSATVPGAPAPSSAPASYPAAPRRRGWVLPVVVAAVVAVVIIAALFVTGVVHFGAASSNPVYETFSQAESVAGGSAGASGGTWYAAFGSAISTPTSLLYPTTNLTALTSLNCTFVWPHGEPANIPVPATGPTAGVGASAMWEFGFKNASNALLIVIVSDGVASNLVTITGKLCESYVAYLAPFPSGVVNSPAIVATANQAGGSAFLAAHSNASQIWAAYGGIQLGELGSTSPEWYVEDTTCALPGYSGEVGAVFNVTIGGTSGAVINSSSGTVGCAPTLPSDLVAPLHGGEPGLAARKAI